MEFWFSGEVESDIGESSRLSSNDVENALNAIVKRRHYGNIDVWGAIQIILNEQFGSYDEVKKFWRKKKELEFRLKIDHATFKAADDLGKRCLIFALVLRSIEEARKLDVPDFDFDRLEADVRKVGRDHGWV